jgi:hypothetical protein
LARLLASLGAQTQPERHPTLIIIGDSTVRNNTRGQFGWGTSLADLFDPSRITVENRALGGDRRRSADPNCGYLRLTTKQVAELIDPPT